MLPPKMMIASGALLAASFIAASAAQAQITWYVNDDGDAGNGCTSWLDACPELQTALSLAGDGDQIWVAAGVYVPSEVDYPEYLRSATFELISGVEIYGGFDGTESTLDQRAGLFDQTILSGDLNGDGGPAGNSYHVVIGSGTDSTARLDGFTITGGSADGAEEWGMWEVDGGGMFIDSGSPRVANCIFSGNFAVSGGGLYSAGGSTAFVSNCTFAGNTAAVSGGGMCSWNSSPTVIGCSFVDNHELGGYCSPFICWDGGSGGGMSISGGSPTIVNCAFLGNIAEAGFMGGWGGGMATFGSSATVVNCSFSGNMAIGYGDPDPSIGGGLLTSGSPHLTNCTFSGNTADSGGGMYLIYSSPTVTNSIFWGDSGGEIVEGSSSLATVSYSDVQGGWPGIGNIDADPLFEDADSADLHLQPGSPCIDAADNMAVPADAADLDDDGDTDEPIPFDLDGNPRLIDDPWSPDTGAGDCPMVDMGAYEFQEGSADCCPADLDGDGAVGAADLAELLGNWGPCEGCPADLDGDDAVGAFDLALLLGNWGPCS